MQPDKESIATIHDNSRHDARQKTRNSCPWHQESLSRDCRNYQNEVENCSEGRRLKLQS